MNLKYILNALAIVGVMFFVASCSNTSEPNKDSLKTAIEEFNDAFRRGDVNKLSSMITADYTHTNGAWKSFGKDQWLGYMTSRSEKLASGQLTITQYEMDEVAIKFSTNAAFVTFRIKTAGIEEDQPFEKAFRVSTLWVYENNRWLRSAFHDTQIE